MDIYCANFEKNRVNGKMLKLLNVERLLAVGVSSELHRLYLLEEIATLFAPQGLLIHTDRDHDLTALFHLQAPPLPQSVPTLLCSDFSLDRSLLPTQTMLTTRTI